MRTAFAALVFKTGEISDRALSQGFAVALGGFDVPRPHVLIAEVIGAPGVSVAFYQSGAKLAKAAEHEEFEHARDLFEEELSPAVGVLDAVAEFSGKEPTIYAILYAEDPLVDDVWRVGPGGYERRYARDDADEGLVAGIETEDRNEETHLDLEVRDDATEAEEREAIAKAVGDHRGSAFLSRELGFPAIRALVRALFDPDQRRVDVRLVDPSPASIEEETKRLNRALRRVDGRGAFDLPSALGGVETPAVARAFVKAYDWADPSDPQDLYRELSIGSIEGTLRFLRRADLEARGSSAAWARPAARSLFPIAELVPSSLGRSHAKEATIALAEDRESLLLVRPDGASSPAGPTFGELLRYLSLGWTKRSAEEEDLIGALMLRAKLRVTPR